jgi:hypothetical protein
MSEFLETLKSRWQDAQKRLQVAQANMQKAQAEFQAVAQETASWQNAIHVETRKEQQSAGTQGTPLQIEASAPPPFIPAPSGMNEPNRITKTESVRQVLSRHPNGIEPAEMWKALHGQITNRAYMYSVLKRLKDKGEATERRGKYFVKINPKPEERPTQ